MARPAAAVTGAVGPGGGQPRTAGRRRVLRHDRWAQGQAGDGSRVTLVLAGAGDAGVAARGGGVSRALRGGPGAPGVSGAEWGAVAGGGNRAAGERPHGARHRLHLRSGAVSRGGMGLREGNGAHSQSADTLERSRWHSPPRRRDRRCAPGQLWYQ